MPATGAHDPARDTQQPPPWYRQFWPWFLIALPASSIVAGVTTVFIAGPGPPPIAREQPIKRGLTADRQFTRERHAAALGLQAGLRIDGQRGALVRVRLESSETLDAARAALAFPQRIELHLLHPTDPSADRRLTLTAASDGSYAAQTREGVDGRWRLQLDGGGDQDGWRLHGALEPVQRESSLQPLLRVDGDAGGD